MFALRFYACHEWFAKAQNRVLIVSGRSFQIVCSAVSGPLHSAVSVWAPGIVPTWLLTCGSRVGSGLAVWQPWVLVSEFWADIWCKNIHTVLTFYSDFGVGTFYFASPCSVTALATLAVYVMWLLKLIASVDDTINESKCCYVLHDYCWCLCNCELNQKSKSVCHMVMMMMIIIIMIKITIMMCAVCIERILIVIVVVIIIIIIIIARLMVCL